MRSLRKRLLPGSGQPTAAVPAWPLELTPPFWRYVDQSQSSARAMSVRTLGIHLPKFPYGVRGRARCQPSRAAPVVDLEIPAPFFGISFVPLGFGYNRLSCVGAHQLGPIFFQQVGAGEDVCPDDLAANCDDNSNRILIAKLLDQALIIVLNGFGNGIHLLLNFFVVHHSSI